MAGSWGPSKAFLQRRKKRASSRRWAVMSKRLQETPEPIITPVTTQLGNCDPITQTSPVPLLGVRVLLLEFGRICQIWRNCLSQSFAGFLKTFFFWREYAKQLETLQNQMAELQREMGALHSALQSSKEKQDILVAVTLRDLQAVKLRKVIASRVKSKRTPEKIRAPLVTAADLQNESWWYSSV
ncbi:unnamed protein product [Coregonus sp. 'balchen']|nr:unnamed protein product [Coregonus sp. 'balchen']